VAYRANLELVNYEEWNPKSLNGKGFKPKEKIVHTFTITRLTALLLKRIATSLSWTNRSLLN
jgi:hypothetical protein